MPDIYSINITSKISWLKRLISKEDIRWKCLMWKLLNIHSSLLLKKMPLAISNNSLSKFYKQVLHYWIITKSIPPIDSGEILNEYIFESSFVKIDNKILIPKDLGIRNNMHKNLKIVDILNLNEGSILPMHIINQKLQCDLNFMNYNNLVKAIPKHWKDSLKGIRYHLELNLPNSVYLQVNSKLCLLTKLSNKDLYKEIVRRKAKPPTAINAWMDLFPFLETANWNELLEKIVI